MPRSLQDMQSAWRDGGSAIKRPTSGRPLRNISLRTHGVKHCLHSSQPLPPSGSDSSTRFIFCSRNRAPPALPSRIRSIRSLSSPHLYCCSSSAGNSLAADILNCPENYDRFGARPRCRSNICPCTTTANPVEGYLVECIQSKEYRLRGANFSRRPINRDTIRPAPGCSRETVVSRCALRRGIAVLRFSLSVTYARRSLIPRRDARGHHQYGTHLGSCVRSPALAGYCVVLVYPLRDGHDAVLWRGSFGVKIACYQERLFVHYLDHFSVELAGCVP